MYKFKDQWVKNRLLYKYIFLNIYYWSNQTMKLKYISYCNIKNMPQYYMLYSKPKTMHFFAYCSLVVQYYTHNMFKYTILYVDIIWKPESFFSFESLKSNHWWMVKESVLVSGPFTTDAAVGSGWVSDVSFTFTPLKPQKKDKLLCLFPSETTEEEKWTVLFRQGSRRRKDHYIQFRWKPQPSEKCS